MSASLTIVRSGDLRPPANDATWPAQLQLEQDFAAAAAKLGVTSNVALDVDPVLGHGFITSQKMGMEVFRNIDPDAPLVSGHRRLAVHTPCPQRIGDPSWSDSDSR